MLAGVVVATCAVFQGRLKFACSLLLARATGQVAGGTRVGDGRCHGAGTGGGLYGIALAARRGVAPRNGAVRGQIRAQGAGVGLDHVGEVALAHPRQGVERQSQAHGRVAGHQVHALIAQKPGAGGPFWGVQAWAIHRLDRQHITHHRIEFLLEHPAQAGALHFIVKPGLERVHIDRQAALAP